MEADRLMIRQTITAGELIESIDRELSRKDRLFATSFIDSINVKQGKVNLPGKKIQPFKAHYCKAKGDPIPKEFKTLVISDFGKGLLRLYKVYIKDCFDLDEELVFEYWYISPPPQANQMSLRPDGWIKAHFNSTRPFGSKFSSAMMVTT